MVEAHEHHAGRAARHSTAAHPTSRRCSRSSTGRLPTGTPGWRRSTRCCAGRGGSTTPRRPGAGVEALTWSTPDGIAVRPLYTAADVVDLPDVGVPGLRPFVRGDRPGGAVPDGWDVRPGTPTPTRRRARGDPRPISRTVPRRSGSPSATPAPRSPTCRPSSTACSSTSPRSCSTRPAPADARGRRRGVPGAGGRARRPGRAARHAGSRPRRGPAPGPAPARTSGPSPARRCGRPGSSRWCAPSSSTACRCTSRAARTPRSSATCSRPAWPTCARSPPPASVSTPPPGCWSCGSPPPPSSSRRSRSCARRAASGRGCWRRAGRRPTRRRRCTPSPRRRCTRAATRT